MAVTLGTWALATLLGGCHSEPLDSSVAGGASDQSHDDNGWTATASNSSLDTPPQNALDGDLTTHWSSGKPQAADEWFQLDFRQTLVVSSIELDLGTDSSDASYDDYPRGYFVRLSATPNDETADVVASGAGKTPITHINLKGAAGRYVFIRQTFTDAHSWSIHELRADVSAEAP